MRSIVSLFAAWDRHLNFISQIARTEIQAVPDMQAVDTCHTPNNTYNLFDSTQLLLTLTPPQLRNVRFWHMLRRRKRVVHPLRSCRKFSITHTTFATHMKVL